MGTRSTMVELVQDLEAIKIGQPDYFKSQIDVIISEAKAGEFHDYKNKKFDCGKVALCTILLEVAHGFGNINHSITSIEGEKRYKDMMQLVEKVQQGWYDETADEEDKEMMRKDVPKEMWGMLGL